MKRHERTMSSLSANHRNVDDTNNDDITESPPKRNKTEPSFVWFALWRDGELVVDELEATGLRNIAALRKAVHNQLRNRLQDLDAADLTVYPPQAVEGEEVRLHKEQFGVKLRVGAKIPDTPDGDMRPILVVAPKKETPNLTNSHGIDTHNTNERPPKKVAFALWRDGELLADMLELTGLRNIADLRDAVKVKFPDSLKGIEAARLKVYEPQKVEGEEARLRKEQFGKELHFGDNVPDTPDDGKVPILVVVPDLTTAPKLIPFDDFETLHKPCEIPLVPLGSHEPKKFCTPTADWLDTHVTEIIKEASRGDSDGETRCRPSAFIRCSRGGKTRALKEINRELRNREKNVLYVSFNDFSNVKWWELLDPTRALCRRIVYAAMKIDPAEKLNHETFNKKACFLDVTPEQITSWLGSDTPCILLIDELNVLIGSDIVSKRQNKEFGLFLKENFLANRNRHFVFSSHIATKANELSNFMDNQSSRMVRVSRLPTIATLDMAQNYLEYPELTPTVALYYGLIPALLFENRNRNRTLQGVDVDNKRTILLDKCALGWNDNSIRNMLKTYVDGEVSHVQPELLPLMDVIADKKTEKERIVWIFCHMSKVLERICSNSQNVLSIGIQDNCGALHLLLQGLVTEKPESGDAWESLFCATLLIRLITGSFTTARAGRPYEGATEKLLPLSSIFSNCRVSYNKYFENGNPGEKVPKRYTDVRDVDELLEIIAPPKGDTAEETQQLYPHVALYKPPHTKFEVYDMFVVAYESAEASRKVFGYQLKEGYRSAGGLPAASSKCDRSFLVCGRAAHQPQSGTTPWTAASDGEVSSFLGNSGSVLSPKEWRKFAKEGSNTPMG